MVKWMAIVLMLVGMAHGAQVAPRFRVQSTLPSGVMQFEVSDTSATMHVPLWIGGARDAQWYRASSGVIASSGSIQSDGGAWYATSSGALGPTINGSIAGTFHSEFGFNLPGTTAVGTWNFVHGSAPIFTVTRLNSNYGQIAIGAGTGLQMTQTGAGTASVTGTWDFAGLKIGGAALSFPLAISQGGTGADLSGQTGLLRVDEKDSALQVVSDNTAAWDLAYSHKTAEDSISGLVKGNGAGGYSAVTDNSASWNTAYSLSHTAATVTGQNYLSINGSQQITAGQINLAGTHVTGTLPDANVASTIARDSELPTRNSLGLDTDDSPQFGGISINAILPTLTLTHSDSSDSGSFGINMLDEEQYADLRSIFLNFNNTHRLDELGGTFTIQDAGGIVYSHNGSTHQFIEPVYVSAASTAAVKVGSRPALQVDTANNRVGIGTNNPTYAPLHIYVPTGAASKFVWLASGGGGSRITSTTNGASKGTDILDDYWNSLWTVRTRTSGTDIDTGWANRIVVPYSGDALQVVGPLQVGKTATYDATIKAVSDSNLYFQTGNLATTRMTINASDGHIGVAAAPDATHMFKVNGSFIATDYYSGDGTQGMTGTVAFTDADSKTNSVTIKDGLITAWSQS